MPLEPQPTVTPKEPGLIIPRLIPELKPEDRLTELSAQHLYDLRELTGYASGTDLHDEFRQLLDEPSPSGYATIDLTKHGESLTKELTDLNSPLWKILPEIGRYDIDNRFFEGQPLAEPEKGTLKAQMLYFLQESTPYLTKYNLTDMFNSLSVPAEGIVKPGYYPGGDLDIPVDKLGKFYSIETNPDGKTNMSIVDVLNQPTWKVIRDIVVFQEHR